MAKRKKGSGALLWIVIIVLGFILLKDKISFGGGDNDACEGRGVDDDHPGRCLVSSSGYDGLIVITGNTANSPVPNLDFTDKNSELHKALGDVFYGDKDVSIISVAGNNSTINSSQKYKPKNNLNASKSNFIKLAKEINEITKQSPTEPGADYLGAILKAADIKESQNLKRPMIVIVGSGFSDRGVLDFAHDDVLGRYSRDENVMNIVSGNKSVKEGILKGAFVEWRNIGVVSKPQSEIDRHYQSLTEDIYSNLFDYFGANYKILGDTNISDYASVKTDYTVGQVYVARLQKGDTFNVNGDIARFVADKPELINRDEVKEKLQSFASNFDNSSNLRLRVTGFIAFCDDRSSLGEERASVIRDILVELGVTSDKIDVYGQPGAPSSNPNEAYTCNSDLPDTERRTVRIEVVEG